MRQQNHIKNNVFGEDDCSWPISKITQLDIKETLTEYCAFTYYLNNVLYLMSLAAVLI